MKEKDKKKIINEIMKAGLPTEVATMQILKKNGYWTHSQVAFIDQEESKLRSIDIKAFKSQIEKSPKSSSKRVVLYIECKKSWKSSIVFYCENSTSVIIKTVDHVIEGPSLLFSLSNIFNFNDEIAISYSICESRDDFLIEAIMQILKAIKYYEKHIKPETDLIIPVMVYNGDMYKYIHDDENPNIKEIDYVSYVSNGLSFDATPTIIDIVKLDKLDDYLKRVNEIYENMPKKNPFSSVKK